MKQNLANGIVRRTSRLKGMIPFASLIIVTTAGLFGCLSIFAARSMSGDPLFFAVRQLLWLAAGAAVFLAAAATPFRYWKAASPWLLVFSFAMLVLVIPFGLRVNGMRGWFNIFGAFTVQPSEFAKVFFILYLSVCAGLRRSCSRGGFIWMFCLTAGAVTLLLLEPDFGGGLMFFCAFLAVVCAAGAGILPLTAALACMTLASLMFLCSNDYALKRILAWSGGETESAWHVEQFKYTLAHGGWFGSEHGAPLWSNAFLPLPHTDSLFASMVEASGFVGGAIVISCFFAMGAGFCVASWKPADKCARIFIFTVGTTYLVQALLHIGVNCVLLPPTGITLPLLSYGGSSLLSVMLAFGISFSAAMRADEEHI